jgi:type I restriction enzyme S subunit
VSWPLVKLGTVSEFIRNGASIKQSNDAAGLPITRIETIADRTVNLDKCGFADVSESEYLNYRLRNGDILISHINSEKHLAKCAIFESDRGDIVHGMNLLCLRPSSGVIFSKYLFHYLSCPVFLRLIPAITKKSVNQASFTVTAFKDLEIPLPPLSEQKRIAAILDKADAIRRKRQQAIQLADDFLRAVFLDMFGDPVTNPKGFRKGPITELADIITGNAFKSDEYVSDSEVAVRLCRGTNVLTSYFDWSDTAYWPKDQLDGLERYLLSSGDVILAMDRPWISSGLKVCIFPDQEVDTYLVQRVARLRPKEAMFSEYIYSCIKSQAFEKHCCPTETTVPHISPVELRGYEVLIPDKTALTNYHATVGKIKSAIAGMQDAASYAGNAFESLSQKAFSGQL